MNIGQLILASENYLANNSYESIEAFLSRIS